MNQYFIPLIMAVVSRYLFGKIIPAKLIGSGKLRVEKRLIGGIINC